MNAPQAPTIAAFGYAQAVGGTARAVRALPGPLGAFGRPATGWTDERTWHDAVHPEDRGRVDATIRDAEAAGAYELEYRLIGAGGEIVPVRDHAMLEPARRGAPAAVWQGVMVDVSERRGMEARLYEAETRYRSLVEQIPAITYVDLVDANLSTTYISPQIGSVLGVLPQEYIDHPDLWAEMLHPEDRERALGQYLEGRASGQPFSFEYRLIRRDGRVVWFRDDAMVISDAAGTPILVQGVMLDVTEAKRADEALRRSEQLYRDVVDTAQDVVFTVGGDGTYTSFNPAFERVTGWSREDWVGKTFGGLVHPDDVGAAFGILAKIAAGQSVAFELRILMADGSFHFGDFTLTPQFEQGQVVGALGICRDITDRKQTEIELGVAREVAEEANRAKSEFLANMSHEIRTPLNAVIGLSGLMLDTELDDEQRDYLETIRSSGDGLLAVINDILDFSKIEAGRMEVEHVPFDVRACVEESLDLVASVAAAKGLEIAYLVDQHVPPVLVGDVTRLRQVLVNLLSNAVKFTATGEVVVTVSSRPRDVRRHDVHFAVIDTGVGIPPEKIDRLFDSFSQLDASITRQYGGTGLGLAISKSLCEMMGGGMWAESTQGAGSTFHFTILAEIGPEQAIRRLPGADLAGRRVLVVDDSATNRLILTKQLRTWEVIPVEASSAEEALTLLRGGAKFDAAVLDMIMPSMDGEALGEAIAKLPEAAGMPLLMLTSLGRQREGRAFSGETFSAYLAKPVKPSRLHDVLAQALATMSQFPAGAKVDRGAGEDGADDLGRLDTEMGMKHPLRILLAEDNAVNRKVATKLLERMGYRPASATNGLEVLEALSRQVFDVVLMDVAMPEMDGLEASRRIRREMPEIGRPRIVAMTANAMAGDRERCFEAGMDDYVSKPIDVAALTAALRRSSRLPSDVKPANGFRTHGDAAELPAGGSEPRAPGPAHDAPGPPPDAPGSSPGSPERASPAVDPAALASFAKELGPSAAEVVAEIIDTFLHDTPELIAHMREAVAADDALVLDRAAHTLKSSSATVGAMALSAHCGAVETGARAGRAAVLTDAVEDVAAEFERVRLEFEAGIAA